MNGSIYKKKESKKSNRNKGQTTKNKKTATSQLTKIAPRGMSQICRCRYGTIPAVRG